MCEPLLRTAAKRPLTADEETELIDALTAVARGDSQERQDGQDGREPPMDAETFAHIVWHNENVATWMFLFSPLDTESLVREIIAESNRAFGDVDYRAADPEVRLDMLEFETLERRVYTKALEFLNI
jgi:hypothetical protein